MKIKLTIRFLLYNLIIFHIGYIVFIAMNLIIISNDISLGEKLFNVTFNIREFIDDTIDDIGFTSGSYNIKDETKEVLIDNGIWIQILDPYNKEVFNINKPNEIQNEYRTAQLINNKFDPWRSDKPSTLMVEEIDISGEINTVVIGFPIDKVFTYKFLFTDEGFRFQFIYLGIAAISLTLIVGFLFSRSLASPISNIINDIELLKEGKPINNKNKNSLYRSVNENILKLSTILDNNKLEREKVDKAKEEWIENIAHDLKTPLSSINGYAELLSAEDYEISIDDANRYGDIIREKSKYMKDIIDDLSLIYKLKNKVLPFKFKEKNLINIVRDVIIDILNDPIFSDREINIDYDNENTIILCDEKYIKRSLNNFIINALVHNPIDTVVDINIKEKYDEINIIIKDNGQGVREEELNNIFNRYYRGSNTQENTSGSGLGMAISKEIINGHCGEIVIESRVGIGSIINIKI